MLKHVRYIGKADGKTYEPDEVYLNLEGREFIHRLLCEGATFEMPKDQWYNTIEAAYVGQCSPDYIEQVKVTYRFVRDGFTAEVYEPKRLLIEITVEGLEGNDSNKMTLEIFDVYIATVRSCLEHAFDGHEVVEHRDDYGQAALAFRIEV